MSLARTVRQRPVRAGVFDTARSSCQIFRDPGGTTLSYGDTPYAGELTVTAPGASDAKRYVRSVSLNGRNMARTWLDWDQPAHGGKPAHRLSTEPSSWGTGPGAEPPSVGATHRG